MTLLSRLLGDEKERHPLSGVVGGIAECVTSGEGMSGHSGLADGEPSAYFWVRIDDIPVSADAVMG